MRSTALAFVLVLSLLLVCSVNAAKAPVNRTSSLRASSVAVEEVTQEEDYIDEDYDDEDEWLDEDYDEEWMDDLDEWQQEERALTFGGGGGGGGGQKNVCKCPLPLSGKRVPAYCRRVNFVCPGDPCPGGGPIIDCDGGIGIPPGQGMMNMMKMMKMKRPMKKAMQGPRKLSSKGSRRRDLENDEEEEHVVEQRELKGSKVSLKRSAYVCTHG